jgi:hypothetical protein
MYIMFRKLLPDMLLHNPDEETELLEEKVPECVVIRADNGHHARDHLGIITNIWKKISFKSNNTEDVSIWSQNLCCFSLNLNVIEAGHGHCDCIPRHTPIQYFQAILT